MNDGEDVVQIELGNSQSVYWNYEGGIVTAISFTTGGVLWEFERTPAD